MHNPFPGMNPYLEQPELWHQVHNRLIVAIADELTMRQVSLSIGGSVHEPNDAVGRLLFHVLAMAAEFESDLIRLPTCEGMRVAKAKGRLRGKQPKLNRRQEAPGLAGTQR